MQVDQVRNRGGRKLATEYLSDEKCQTAYGHLGNYAK